MNRDFVWFVIVDRRATDPNLIDIEELTCSLGEIMVSNVSLGGFVLSSTRTFHNPRTSCSGVSVSNVIDNGSSIAIFGDVDHLHPNEISVRLS